MQFTESFLCLLEVYESSWGESILREVLEEFSLKKLPLYYEETIEKYDQKGVKNSFLFLFCALAFV